MELWKLENNVIPPVMTQLAAMPKHVNSNLEQFASKGVDNVGRKSRHSQVYLTSISFADSDYNDMCCNQCQLRPSSYQCRPAISNCDIAEYCTGNSSSCPTDKHV